MTDLFKQKVPIKIDKQGNPYIILNLSSILEPLQELVLINSSEIKQLLEENERIRTELKGFDMDGLVKNNKKITELLNKLMSGITVKFS